MNQLPQATALYIPPSDLIPKGDGHARHKWLRTPRREPPARKETSEATVTRVYTTAPVERVWTVQQDWHVRDFLEWRGNPPLGFLKMRCREMDVSYEDTVGESRRHHIIGPRHQLMKEVWEQFRLSLPKIGRLFGGRDHTSVMWALKKQGVDTSKPHVSDRGDEIFSLWRSGLCRSEIARELGLSQSSVVSYVNRQPWYNKPGKKALAIDSDTEIRSLFAAGRNMREIARELGFHRDTIMNHLRRTGVKPAEERRLVKDHATEIKTMLNLGKTFREIGAETGFHPGVVGKFVSKMGWQR